MSDCRPAVSSLVFSFSQSLAPLPIGGSDLTEEFDFIEAFASPFRHGAERIFCNMDRQARLFAQKLIEAAEQRAAASQYQATIHEIG